MRSTPLGIAACAALLAATGSRAQTCSPQWSQELGGGRPPGWVRALAVWDDGTGPGLFIGTRNGTGTLSKWDGARLTYHSVFHDSGADGGLSVLFPHNDGTGDSLWGGGTFAEVDGVLAANIARWDGQAWHAVGLGTDGGVRAMEVFGDSSGPKLFVAGYFTRAGGAFSPGIASWDGQAWNSVGGGVSGMTFTPPGFLGQTATLALRVFEGKGPKSLYVGGMFTHAGGVPSNGVARWDGAAWHALASGLQYLTYAGAVLALETYDSGEGASLYVAGAFTAAGGSPAQGLARWDGEAWYPVTTGVMTPLVTALRACDIGQGLRLYGAPGNVSTVSVAQLTPAGWSVIPGYAAPVVVNTLREFDDGRGIRLFVCGEQENTGAALFSTDGTSWEGTPVAGANTTVGALKTLDDGTGPALYALDCPTIAGVDVRPVGKFDGTAWQRVGEASDVSNVAYDLEVFDDGSGPRLYAAATANHPFPELVVRLVNGHWVGVPGAKPPQVPNLPEVIKAYNDAGRNRLFIAAGFDGMVRAWDGQAWTTPGGGIPGYYAGARPAKFEAYQGVLYLASTLGVHTYAGSTWARASLESLGSAWDLATDGDGPDSSLYGLFNSPGAGSTGVVRKYQPHSGGTWAIVGLPGISGAAALQWFDDGVRPALYACGNLGTMGEATDVLVARWDGALWSPAARTAIDGAVGTLAVTNFARPTLWAGGAFAEVSGISSANIAAYEGCDPCYPDCNRDGALNLADFGCFQTRFASFSDMYGDCNTDGMRNLADFGCFQTKFALGCP